MFSIASELIVPCTSCGGRVAGLRADPPAAETPSRLIVGVVALLLGLAVGYSVGAPGR